MVWGKYVIILAWLCPGLPLASKEHPGHREVASLRQAGRQPTHGSRGKAAKTDIGNLDLFDPLKDTVEATVAAAIADAKAHPTMHQVADQKHAESHVAEVASKPSTPKRSSQRNNNETHGIVASSSNHHQSLAHKIGQVVTHAAGAVETDPKPAIPKRTPHTDRQRQRDTATRQLVDQARNVKLPVMQEEPAEQNTPEVLDAQAAARERNEKPDACANGADVAQKIVQALPKMQQQPLWNLVGPDVLHLGAIVDERLSDIKDSLSPMGDQLLDKFPNLRLRDLPVFCSLPKPFPRKFAWAQPLEATVPALLNFLPFHVRNTPLQSLRFEDMVLVGRRQRELVEQEYQKKEKVWEKHVRKSNFRAVINDKQHAIDELSAKTTEIEKDYSDLRTLYEKGTGALNQFQIRYDEDQTTLSLQRKLLHAENAKVAQLEAVQKEIKDDLVDKREADEERKEHQLKSVLQLKEKTGESLRKQLRDLRGTLDKDREFERRKMEEQQAAIANVTELHRKADNEADALQRHVEELKTRIAAEAHDKARLEKENKDLAEENQRLSGQNAQLSGLEDQLQSEGDALEKEVKRDRTERDRLQKDIDNLETSEHEEETKDAETANLVKEVQNSAKDLSSSTAQNHATSEDKDGDDDDDSDEADF